MLAHLSALAAAQSEPSADGDAVPVDASPSSAEWPPQISEGLPGPGYLVVLIGPVSLPLSAPLPPAVDGSSGLADSVAAAKACFLDLCERGLCVSAQAVGVGGLIAALARLCASPYSLPVGCTVVLPTPVLTPEQPTAPSLQQQLFTAMPGYYLLAIPGHRQAAARILVAERGVPIWLLGRSTGSELVIRTSDGPEDNSFTEILRLPVAQLAQVLDPGLFPPPVPAE